MIENENSSESRALFPSSDRKALQTLALPPLPEWVKDPDIDPEKEPIVGIIDDIYQSDLGIRATEANILELLSQQPINQVKLERRIQLLQESIKYVQERMQKAQHLLLNPMNTDLQYLAKVKIFVDQYQPRLEAHEQFLSNISST